jgi:hypothetical protein
MAGISRVCTGFSNNPDTFRYTHFLPLMRRTISLRISWVWSTNIVSRFGYRHRGKRKGKRGKEAVNSKRRVCMMFSPRQESIAMTTSYYADRCNLYHLQQMHPDWSQQTLAEVLGRHKSWVYKWQARFAEVPANDEWAIQECARGLSRARHTPPERIDPRIEELILAIRDNPASVGLRRTPGPKAILYYLPLARSSYDYEKRLPTSTRTIYLILDRNQRIAHRQSAPEPSDLPLPAPMSSWQIDFKDVSSVKDDPVEPTGKKQHVAEAFNIVE